MSEDWVDERNKAILNTIYYCESCNMILEPGDLDIERHKKDLPSHKLRRVLIVRCGHCGKIVTDSYAQYSPQLNRFWCKNCLVDTHSQQEFHTEPNK
jgi:RNase P subunit RPR2